MAAQQQVTIDWWSSRSAYSLFASDFVLDEAGRGDPLAAARRMAALADLDLLETTDEVIQLAGMLVQKRWIASKGAR